MHGKFSSSPLKQQVSRTVNLLRNLPQSVLEDFPSIEKIIDGLESHREPLRRDVMQTLGQSISMLGKTAVSNELSQYYDLLKKENHSLYNTHLYNEGPKSPLLVEEKVAGVC